MTVKNHIRINGMEFVTPRNYNQLTSGQLLNICRHMLRGSKYMRYHILMELLGLKRGIWLKNRRITKLADLPSSVVATLINHEEVMEWVFNPPSMTDYKISSFRHSGVTYYGPPGGMFETSIAEFIECSMYYGAYRNSVNNGKPKDELLDKIIAVLYRPSVCLWALKKDKSTTQDRRRKNTPSRFNRRQLRLKSLAPELKMALFIQFEGAMEYYAKSFPNAFEGGDGDVHSDGWIKLLMTMSSDIFGNYEQTQETGSYTFFKKVDMNMEQAKKEREHYESIKKKR